jgi:hypothetical protein
LAQSALVLGPVAVHASGASATCAGTGLVVVRRSNETAGTHKSPAGATYASGGSGMSIGAAHDVQSGPAAAPGSSPSTLYIHTR